MKIYNLYTSIIRNYIIFKFNKTNPNRVQDINGQAAGIIFHYAMLLANSPALNRDQKINLFGGLGYIFVDTAYHQIISDEIKKLLAQPQTSAGVEPTQKFTPLGYIERKTKEAKTANASMLVKQISVAIKNLQEKLEEEQTIFFTEEPEKGHESGDDGEFITYIQNTILQAKLSGEKFDELRDILGTLEKNHPYYEEVKKAVDEIKAQKTKQ